MVKTKNVVMSEIKNQLVFHSRRLFAWTLPSGNKGLLFQKSNATFNDNVFAPPAEADEYKLSAIKLSRALEDKLEARRRHTRVNVEIPVYYKHRSKTQEASSLDLSISGIRMVLPSDVEVGHEIDLKLKLPNAKKLCLFKGVVVWKREQANNSATALCGIAFKEEKKEANTSLTYFLADKLCRAALQYTKDFSAEPVTTTEEIKKVFKLLYKGYLARGYCEENVHQMHYHFHCFLPNSRIFALKKNGNIVGTVSLIVDSPCGVPMEGIFPKEIAAMRRSGKKVAEVSLLTLDSSIFGKKSFFSLGHFEKQACLLRLFKVMYNYARLVAGVTDLVIAVHPKHATLYKYLQLKEFGPIKKYPGACNNLALPMTQNIQVAVSSASKAEGIGCFFLNYVEPLELLSRPYRWNKEDLAHFLCTVRPLWPSLPQKYKAFFLETYPALKNQTNFSHS